MPFNMLLTKHKCHEELTGPLPDDETSIDAHNLRSMRHLENDEKNNLFVKEIISTSSYDKEADVKMVSGFDKHSIKVDIYQIYFTKKVIISGSQSSFGSNQWNAEEGSPGYCPTGPG